MKHCIKCKIKKQLYEFTKNKVCKDGYENVCLSCNKKRKQKYYNNNKQLYRIYYENRRCLKNNAIGKITKELINELMLFQDYKCLYCNCDVTKVFHLEHIIPLSRGGNNLKDNLCIACPTCNLRKNNKPFWEFVLLLHEEYWCKI